MKLNKKSLIELREKLSKELMLIKDGAKIQLERELLDDLLFEKEIDKNGKKFKKLVWSGVFLQFVDLNSISFDDVDWSCNTDKYLANTNCKIDFAKGYYSSLNDGGSKKTIKNCRFDGTDLSDSNIDFVDIISVCSLKDTNVDLKDFFEQRKSMSLVELNGIDLTGVKIDLVDYPDVCFTDTNACLMLDPEDKRMQYNHTKSYYGANYSKDFYAGCYVNGKKIRYRQQDRNMAQIRLAGYEAYEKSTINSTLNLIRKHK